MAETPDSHDLDKLTRWHQGLNSAAGGRFPVCAVFLTSGEDNRAHDIFRVYRTAFEGLGAGFHDLVIFGQHGASSTSAAMVSGLGLAGLQVPLLALIAPGDPPVCHVTVLPAGALSEGEPEEDGDEVPWRKALETVRRAVGEGSPLSLEGVKGLERRDFPAGTLADSVGIVKQQVEKLTSED